MTKSLPSLAAIMAITTLSANAQVTQKTTEVTEATETRPGKIKEVRKAVPVESETSTTVRKVAPAAPVTTTTIREVVPAAPVTTTTVREVAPTAPGVVVTQQFDPVVARRHLSIAPRAVTITREQRPIDRTVTVETRREPVRRVYNVERNVVIVEEQGKSLELPFVTLPVLFVVDTAQLLDAESRAALEQTATLIKGITQTEPTAIFDIEGHTSTEGTDEHNSRLSAERATRVFTELTQRYGVPATALTAHGYGEKFAMNPEGSESQLQADRRVLVVRTR